MVLGMNDIVAKLEALEAKANEEYVRAQVREDYDAGVQAGFWMGVYVAVRIAKGDEDA